MGCGESKHDVATGNTVARKKSNVGETKKTKDIETVLETEAKGNETDSLQQQQEEEGELQNVNPDIRGDHPDEADITVRDIAENTEMLMGREQKEKQDDGIAEGQDPAAERLISKESPNRYFSSRKEEEAVDGISSEGKSDYYTPRHEAGEESVFHDNEKANNGVEATNLVEKTVRENKTKAESASVKEENLAKDKGTGKVNTNEAEVSAPASVEKNLDDEKCVQEQQVASPTKEVKTVWRIN